MTIKLTKTNDALTLAVEARASIFEIRQICDQLVSESEGCHSVCVQLSDDAKVDVAAIQLLVKLEQWFSQQKITFRVSHNNHTLATKLDVMQLCLPGGDPELQEAAL